MESRMWIIFTLLSIYYHSSNASILRLEASISKETANVGETVVFTCRVEKSEEDQEIGIQLAKVLMMPDGQYQDQKINLAGTTSLEPRYRETGRYSLVRREDGPTVSIFELTIDNVEREDNAPIGCMEVVEDDYEVVNFIVRTPVKDVYYGNISDGTTVVFEQDMGQMINCTAAGGSPPADVEFYIEDVNGDQHDYTEFFHRHVSNEVECPSAGTLGETDCLMHRRNEVMMSADDFVPLPEHNGRQLVCRGHVAELEGEPMEARINVDVLHKPEFMCHNHHQVDPHTSNYELRCLVYANPPADQRDAYFRFEYGPLEVSLKHTEATEDDAVDCRMETSNEMPNSFEMILTFDTITEEDYKTYTLVAENERGQSEYPIYITEVGAAHPGAASALQAMSLLATAIMALAGRLFL